MECLIGPKLVGEHFEKLRGMLTFVKKTTDQSSAGCDLKLTKWDGPLVVDEGIMVVSDPLAVRTKKMIYRYENVAGLLLDGWR